MVDIKIRFFFSGIFSLLSNSEFFSEVFSLLDNIFYSPEADSLNICRNIFNLPTYCQLPIVYKGDFCGEAFYW